MAHGVETFFLLAIYKLHWQHLVADDCHWPSVSLFELLFFFVLFLVYIVVTFFLSLEHWSKQHRTLQCLKSLVYQHIQSFQTVRQKLDGRSSSMGIVVSTVEANEPAVTHEVRIQQGLFH